MGEQYFLEDQLIIITKQTLDLFLQQDNPADLIGLYTFYYYTAKWQRTNQIRCTTSYAANGLHMGEQKIRGLKKQLIELGLIEDVAVRNDMNQIEGHYIRMKYLFRQDTEMPNSTLAKNHSMEKCEGEKSHPCSFPECGSTHSVENCKGNALSDININALSVNKGNALSDSKGAKPKKSAEKEKAEPKKPKPKKASGYEVILAERIENEELRTVYLEFIKMRELIKKPLTDYALTRIISKVEGLAPGDVEMQKAILDQSIEKNWQGVFPLKDDGGYGNTFYGNNGYSSRGAQGSEADTDNIFLKALRQEHTRNGGEDL